MRPVVVSLPRICCTARSLNRALVASAQIVGQQYPSSFAQSANASKTSSSLWACVRKSSHTDVITRIDMLCPLVAYHPDNVVSGLWLPCWRSAQPKLNRTQPTQELCGNLGTEIPACQPAMCVLNDVGQWHSLGVVTQQRALLVRRGLPSNVLQQPIEGLLAGELAKIADTGHGYSRTILA